MQSANTCHGIELLPSECCILKVIVGIIRMIKPRPIPGVDSDILEHEFSTSAIQPPKGGTLVIGGM